jgi:RNA-directed DNA polymerase
VFHRDSYGYRPGKSAHDALVKARQRCWAHDWVLDLDIKSFFDEIDWDLLMRAVRRHTDCPWVLLYLERWLRAPVSMPNGDLVDRESGTPQGAVVSPILTNLFLHYAFDLWMQREYPTIPFERYADDAICHCASEAQALELRQALDQRFAVCWLRLHPEKTKIVYCKDANRPGGGPERSFDFLGYTFRSRAAVGRNQKRFVSFIPAVSDKAAKRIRLEVRRRRLHLRSDLELDEIAGWTRPFLSGWCATTGGFTPRSFARTSARSMRSSCDGCLANTNVSGDTRWRSGSGCVRSSGATRPCSPIGPWDQRLDDGSRMNREVHVRF